MSIVAKMGLPQDIAKRQCSVFGEADLAGVHYTTGRKGMERRLRQASRSQGRAYYWMAGVSKSPTVI